MADDRTIDLVELSRIRADVGNAVRKWAREHPESTIERMVRERLDEFLQKGILRILGVSKTFGEWEITGYSPLKRAVDRISQEYAETDVAEFLDTVRLTDKEQSAINKAVRATYLRTYQHTAEKAAQKAGEVAAVAWVESLYQEPSEK